MPPHGPFKILVFSKTCGYRHDSIPAGIASIQKLADEKKAFTVDTSEDAEACFNTETLAKYTVVVLLQCIGDFLNIDQIEALKQFVTGGGGVVAIHGAAAGMPNNEWYGKLVGAHFESHPDPETGTVIAECPSHFIMNCHRGKTDWKDEWYNFTTHPRENKKLKVLLRGDTTSFKGGKHGEDHPLSWCQKVGKGRSYFTALGHFDEAYEDEWFMSQIFGAIIWAAKDDDGPCNFC